MIICQRCNQPVRDPYEHQLQDGWECDGLGPPMEVCPNCSQPVNLSGAHRVGAGWRCQGSANVSPGEQRIINAIGNENATGTIMFEFRALQANVNALREELKERKDLAVLGKELRRVVEERDALRAEVEFLRIKVDEMQSRRVAGTVTELPAKQSG